GEGVGPAVATVGGPEEEVRAVGQASASFVHAGDIHVACGQVAGDLHVADEGIAVGNLSLAPSRSVVGREADEDAGAAIEVIPGNVHPSKEGRGCIVVGPARLSVVVAAVVNAKMGPAIRVHGSGGLVPAEAKTAAGQVNKDSEPSLGWLVEQSNRVAQGIADRVLTV